jgi:radical SAM superfamily enzyme YgiQ (UPF0313 family)
MSAERNIDILLVQTPNIVGSFFNLPGKEVPLSLCSLGAYLKKKGWRCDILDLDFHARISPLLEERLHQQRPKVLGISAYTTNISWASCLAERAKREDPSLVTVIGGFHASALPVRTLEEFPAFDLLVAGEGEITTDECLRRLDRGQGWEGIQGLGYREDGGEIVLGEPRALIEDLDSLPFADRSFLPVTEYVPDPGNYFRLPTTGILFSRGCPFRCTYCSKAVFGHRIRYRSEENFLAEVKDLIARYGIRDYRLEDEGPTLNTQRMIALCEKILEGKLDITWNCFSRVDTVDEAALRIMRDAGCYHVTYGIESSLPETLARINKRIDLERAVETIRTTMRLGIECKVNFILGFPWETLEQVRSVVRFAKALSPDLATFNLFKPLPGSVLYDELAGSDRLRHSSWEDYFTTSGKLLFESPIPEAQLHRELKKAVFGFYLRPRFLLQRVRRLVRHPRREALTLLKGFSVLCRELMGVLRTRLLPGTRSSQMDVHPFVHDKVGDGG